MTKHAEQRLVPHLPENLYQLVTDVNAYPQFLPWCLAQNQSQDEQKMIADLMIGFRIYREKFTHVDFNPDD